MAGREPLKRNKYCGDIRESDVGSNITVYGWVNTKRELGAITFIDLRDRQGLLQVVVGENSPHRDTVKSIGREHVLAVGGEVVRRSNPNPDLPTGHIELIANEITVLNESEVPPFLPDNRSQVSEELRFKYRYLDLRNPDMQKNLKVRSAVNLKVREYLSGKGFLDIETPVLTRATPEGARDYLVPSRVYKGKMFALPQSPQLFKQLLMVSGFERYFQITKCFRDEDLRADRQPEFTQVDIEMSFAEPEELYAIIESLVKEIFATAGEEIPAAFPRLSYADAMELYGTDAPDLRIPFTIQDFTEASGILDSSILKAVAAEGGRVKGLVIPDAASFSRKVLDSLNEAVREWGGQGVIWLKRGEQGYKSALKVEADRIETFFKENKIDSTHIVFLLAGPIENVRFLAGRLRVHLGEDYKKEDRREFVWVTDFPLFFYNEDEDRLDSQHHPFTSPRHEDLGKLDSQPLEVASLAYDLVLNGVEIGGGSQRINRIELQQKIFRLLKLSDEEMEEKFGFFLEALKYGAPPHLGIALGLDRVVMLLTGEASIREVIPFPKTTSSLCLMTGSPSPVPDKQLSELGIAVKKQK